MHLHFARLIVSEKLRHGNRIIKARRVGSTGPRIFPGNRARLKIAGCGRAEVGDKPSRSHTASPP